jgi:Sec-independent protein translocase protein TatA
MFGSIPLPQLLMVFFVAILLFGMYRISRGGQ